MKKNKYDRQFEKRIIEAIQKNYLCYIWNTIDKVIYKVPLQIKTLRKDYNEIEFDVSEEHNNDLKNILSGSGQVKIFIPDLSIAFASELKRLDNKKIKIGIPEEYTFHERRKHIRVKPEQACFANVNYSGFTPKMSIYDISLGGFSIIYPKSNRVSVEPNTDYQIIIDVYGHKISSKAKCVGGFVLESNKVEDLPYGGYKVAFEFVGLNERDKKYLMDIITTLAIKQNPLQKAE